jgi:hypothetical protein
MDVLGEKRSEIYAELDIALSKELAKYSIEFISVSITDMDAGAEIEAAITAEAVAKKAVETAVIRMSGCWRTLSTGSAAKCLSLMTASTKRSVTSRSRERTGC